MTFTIHTLGCKVNQYESEVMSEALIGAGLKPADKGETSDIYIINSCAVTAESERKARQIVRRSISENPSAYVIVTGCYAQLSADELLAIDGVSYVCGNYAKMEAVNAALLYAACGKRLCGACIKPLEGAKFEPSKIQKSERTRAYVKIEDGCDSVCAYCAIKNARGPVRSKPLADVYDEIAALTQSGYREVVLTGIEISAWGKDLEKDIHGKPTCDLCDLVLSLESIDKLDRVRLGSLDPSLLTPTFTKRLSASTKLCPHFHLSLQSGCDKTLAAMRRRYNTQMVARNVAAIRDYFPSAGFTADTIVGFPGETNEDFEATKSFIADLRLTYNHIFPFSRRKNTEAYDMSCQIDEGEKSRRLHELEKIRDRSRAEVIENTIGGIVEVLFEERQGEIVKGHTRSFIEVGVTSDIDLRGKIGTVETKTIKDGVLIGSLLSVK